jgi:hypothetical protein
MDWRAIAKIVGVYVIPWIIWLGAYIRVLRLLGELPRKWEREVTLLAIFIPITVGVFGLLALHNWIYLAMGLSALVILVFSIIREASVEPHHGYH